ncbi:MAG: hypothetical protein ACI9GH_000588 [Candidatus Paceibacteria bacterium]|jgi:hypothetical protein
MIKFIENLREKPSHKKKAITLFTSLGITAFIFMIWVISFVTSIGNVAVEETVETASPIGAIGNQVDTLFR